MDGVDKSVGFLRDYKYALCGLYNIISYYYEVKGFGQKNTEPLFSVYWPVDGKTAKSLAYTNRKERLRRFCRSWQ